MRLQKSLPALLLVTLAITTACQQKTGKEQSNTSTLQYPVAQKVDSFDTYFGEKIPDPYRWMEDDRSPEVAQWVNEENKVTQGYLSKIDFRDKIRDQLKSIWNYEKQSAPSKHGDYYYFYKNNGLQNQSVLYRTQNLEDTTEEIFLDPNEFSEDGSVSLQGTSFTQDGDLMAYLISEGGSDWRKIVVKDTHSGELIGDTLRNVKFSGVSWKGDEGFFYSSYATPKSGSILSGKTQYHRLFYHKLGTPQSEDQLIFGGEKQRRRYIGGSVTEDGRYLIITAAESTSGNELYVKDLTDPASKIVPVVTGYESEQSVVDNEGSKLFIYTNRNAPNYKLVSVDAAQPEPEHWKEVIPENEHVLQVSSAGGYFFATYLVDVKSEVYQFDYEGNKIRKISLPTAGTVRGFSGDKDIETLYYTFTSFTYPSAVYAYHISSGKSSLYWKPDVNINPDDYVTEQVFYKSKDGTKVPMYIVYKKGLKKDGQNPTYLYAYGGFNISLMPNFSITRMIWLENGGIYAQPNLRGGGEYGEKWHKAGTKMQKQNVFDDFIAAGEYLINNKYTSSGKLAIAGGSNGGLLVGATMTQRPDLMKVALPAVGVMDMLRYHKFTAGAGWASDYGTAEDSKEMFHYLLGYSPVQNVKEGTHYPATMVMTADHDDRVVPAHSFKFAAELQAKQAGDKPVLIRIEHNAGHGTGMNTDKTIEEYADVYAFTWYNMGVNPYNSSDNK